MADKNSFNREQPQHINLNQVAQNFMSGVQRHFDLLAFNLAAHDTVKEGAYDRRVGEPNVLPAPSYHQNFEQLQAYARDLLVRQVINDSLNLTLSAMNNAHFFLSLIKATNASKQVNAEEQKKAQITQQMFVRSKLDEKFNRLEKDYGIMCELEDSIISLGSILQILFKQNKIVRKEQLDNQGKLILELKSAKTINYKDSKLPQTGELIDIRKMYREGDVLSFDDVELQLILVTIASFADSLFQSVAKYARSVQRDR